MNQVISSVFVGYRQMDEDRSVDLGVSGFVGSRRMGSGQGTIVSASMPPATSATSAIGATGKSQSLQDMHGAVANEAFQPVRGLQQQLGSLLQGESEVILFGIHAVDAHGRAVALVHLFIDLDGHLLFTVLPKAGLPARLHLSDAQLGLLSDAFAAEKCDDGSWVIDHGPMDLIDSDEICAFAAELLDQVFGLPDHEFSLVATRIDE